MLSVGWMLKERKRGEVLLGKGGWIWCIGAGRYRDSVWCLGKIFGEEKKKSRESPGEKQPAARELAQPGKVWAEVPVLLDSEQGLEAESPIAPIWDEGWGVPCSSHN